VPDKGFVELERQIDSIVVGERHRRHPGDLTKLTESLTRVGLLQPVTITPDGYLICGYRRLAAAKELGWQTLRVWVRSGISDELTRLLAERDENITHQPLTPDEAAKLYQELLDLVKEDARRRQAATQYGAKNDQSAGQHGHAESAPPGLGALGSARRRAAEMVTGKASYARLEQILEMERIAADRSQAETIRQVATDELGVIRNGGAVDPGYQRVKAAQRVAARMTSSRDSDVDALTDEALAEAKADHRRRVRENRAKRASAAASAKRSTRAFVLTWAELDGWSKRYDVDQVAREVKPDDWTLFLRVVDETIAFVEAVTRAGEHAATSDTCATRHVPKLSADDT
jgi:ParB family chromosome partitioning protein